MIRNSALLAVWLGVGGCGDNGIKDLPPELAISHITISVPEDGVTTVNATAVDADGDKLTYRPTAPAHGELTGTGPEFTYTPVKDYNGPDSLMVVISDGTKQITAMIDITVTPIDDAPVAEDIHAATNEDQGVNVVLVATDIDNETLSYSVVVGPSHGTLTGVAPNLTYTPNLHYFGPDTFTFRASDGSLASGVATATVVVDNVITCGDGVVEGNEQCDDGNTVQGDSCLNNCMLATCGDGQVELEVEQCDDGNGDNTDACLTTCESARCGDSFVWAGEEACDDGNDNNNDACLSSCVLARCGDGFAEAGVEQCDDGNADNTDGCIDTCKVAVCGDGFVEAGEEQCDDGNQDDTDGCHNNCTLPVCGNGITELGEECDDGNIADGDGCGHSCKVERCGDGLTQFGLGEQCDDGNTTDGDGCSSECQVEPFQTTTPIPVSVDLACTTATANAARKITVDGSGNLYVVMQCGNDAYAATSTDRGQTFSPPFNLSADLTSGGAFAVSQVAVNNGPSRVAYAAIMLSSGEVFLRTTQDAGATWGTAVSIGLTSSTSTGLSLQSFNDDIYIGFSTSGGVAVARNHARAVGAFDTTVVEMSIAFFDVLFDVVRGTLVVTADTPAFHVRASSDGGASFAAEVNPPGQEFYSDWAIGNGRIYVSGVNLGPSGSATSLFVIATSDLTSSVAVVGLPAVSTPQSRTVAADAAGNGFVASQLNGGGVQLDRLNVDATAFDPARSLSATGGSPVVAPLPGNQGAAVVYTDGTSVFATVQVYAPPVLR